MPAQRDEKGRFIPGSGGSGGGSGGASFPKLDDIGKFSSMMTKATGTAKSFASGIKGLAGTFKSFASGDLPNATQAMTAFGGAIGGGIADGAKQLSSALGALGPEGQAAGAAIEALGAVLSATVGTMSTLAGMAIDVTQKMDLMRDRFAALAGGTAGGKAVQAMLSKLSATLPFASSQVSEWAQSLLKAGVSADQLEDRLKAVAAAEALGEGGGAAAEAFFKRLGEGGPAATKFIQELGKGSRRAVGMLKEMGVSMEDLGGSAKVAKMSAKELQDAVSKVLQKKGAGPLADMALTFPAILQKAREGFLSLFAKLGPSVKPFMKAVKELFANFNKGTPLMKTLQGVVTKVFGTLFGLATKAVHALQAIFQWFMNSGKAGGMFSGVVAVAKVVWAKLVTIFNVVKAALKPIIALFKGIFSNAMVLKGIRTIFTSIAVVIGAVVLTIATLIGVFVAVAAAVSAFVGLIVGAFMGVVGEVTNFVGSIIDTLMGLATGGSSAASGLIDGLVGGISSGVGAVVSAVLGLAGSAVSALKGALGIHSPSTVFAGMGGNMAEGAAQGMDRGAGRVADSGASLGAAAAGGAAKGMGGGKGGGMGGGITINGGVHIAVPMGTPGAWAEEAFAAFMERLAASQGV